MIFTSSSPSYSSTVEDPPDLSQHHFFDGKDISKTTIDFIPFLLVHGLESVLPIEDQIPSPRLASELIPNISPLEEPLLMFD